MSTLAFLFLADSSSLLNGEYRVFRNVEKGPTATTIICASSFLKLEISFEGVNSVSCKWWVIILETLSFVGLS